MKFTQTKIPEVVLVQPMVYKDDRGYFFESYREDLVTKHLGDIDFIQDNESKSRYGVVRGLHYQLPPYAQSKLVRVISGEILDVALDIRRNSATYGKYVVVSLSEHNKHQLFIPKGFAHGFSVLSKEAVVSYKVDARYDGECERCVRYDDPELNIPWGIEERDIMLSAKDRQAPHLSEAKVFEGVF